MSVLHVFCIVHPMARWLLRMLIIYIYKYSRAITFVKPTHFSRWPKLSKVHSLWYLRYKMTIMLTFENVLAQNLTSPLALNVTMSNEYRVDFWNFVQVLGFEELPRFSCWSEFSKVRSLLDLLCQMTTKLTIENLPVLGFEELSHFARWKMVPRVSSMDISHESRLSRLHNERTFEKFLPNGFQKGHVISFSIGRYFWSAHASSSGEPPPPPPPPPPSPPVRPKKSRLKFSKISSLRNLLWERTVELTLANVNLWQHTHRDHCNTLQHTATHCNTQQHTATHCNTLRHITIHCSTLQHTAAHCSTHTVTTAHGTCHGCHECARNRRTH